MFALLLDVELGNGLDYVISTTLDVYRGIALGSGLGDLVATVRDDGYVSGFNFGCDARGMVAIPVPGD